MMSQVLVVGRRRDDVCSLLQIFNIQVFRMTSGRLLRKHPLPADVEKVLHTLREADDRTAVILGAALLHYCLERLLKSHMKTLSKDEESRVFDSSHNGFLSSMSSQSTMLYALSLIDNDMFHDIKILGTIRNVFAHSLHTVSFEHPDVVADCLSLRLVAAKDPVDKTAGLNKPRVYFHNAIWMQVILLNLFDISAKAKKADITQTKTIDQSVFDSLAEHKQLIFKMALSNLKGEQIDS